MVKIKFGSVEISCNHEGALYLVSLCESALLNISKSGSTSQYHKCDKFIDAIYRAIDADIINITYDEFTDLLLAINKYADYMEFIGANSHYAENIISLLRAGAYNRKLNAISYSSDDFAAIVSQLKFVYESDSFELHFKNSSKVISDFYEKYKAAH